MRPALIRISHQKTRTLNPRSKLRRRPHRPAPIDARGEVIDRVESYTALRTVGAQGDRFLLNGRPTRLRMVLDHGYRPETGLTPPDDDALPPARAAGTTPARRRLTTGPTRPRILPVHGSR